MPRRPRELPPTAIMPKRKRDDREQIHNGQSTQGMPVPNHLLPEDEHPNSQLATKHLRWPLSAATYRGEDHAEPLFVHPRYGVTHWSEWTDQPPTWMDPQLLVAMAEEDHEFQTLVAMAHKKNDVAIYKKVTQCLNRIFEEQYLPYVIEQFQSRAAETVAIWATNRGVQRLLDKPRRPKKRRA